MGRNSMPGGKAVRVDLMNRERPPTRAADDQMATLGARCDTP